MLDSPLNALSFDVEDWYMGLEQGPEHWSGRERRLERGLVPLLDLLRRRRVRATFFVLGACAELHPDLVRRIADEGHEVGSHGHNHVKVYEMDEAAFNADLARSLELLRDLSGQPVHGFRAPYFSITRESLWALSRLRRHGIAYDASIYPGPNYRYGIDGSPTRPYLHQESGVPEFPVSLGRLGSIKYGIGGGYFRILPYAVTRRAIARINQTGQPAMFYLHPWEFDPDHPRIPMPRRIARLTHYFRLGVTLPRFERLLSDVRFGAVEDVLRERRLIDLAPPSHIAPVSYPAS